MARPQELTREQTRLLKKAVDIHQVYQTASDKAGALSEALTEAVADAVAGGISRYRVGQELGWTHQAVDGRLERRQARLRVDRRDVRR